MNAVAVMYVNSHLADLRAEAGAVESTHWSSGAASGRASPPRTAGLRKVLGSDSGPVVPQLKNYPYGG